MRDAPPTRRRLTDSEITLRWVAMLIFAAAAMLAIGIVVYGGMINANDRWIERRFIGVLVVAGLGVVGTIAAYMARARARETLEAHEYLMCPYCARALRKEAIPGDCPGCGGRMHDHEFVRKHWEAVYFPPHDAVWLAVKPPGWK